VKVTRLLISHHLDPAPWAHDLPDALACCGALLGLLGVDAVRGAR